MHQVRRTLWRASSTVSQVKARKPFVHMCNHHQTRSFHTTPIKCNMMGELDAINVLEYDPGRIQITGYISKGYEIGQVRVFGSLIATTNEFFTWNVTRPEDITIESLQIFEFLNPTPNILIIGTGREHVLMPMELRKHFQENGIILEEMSSRNALATFNILNQEGRNVACAILSLDPVDPRELTPEKTPNVFMEIEELSKNDPSHLRDQHMKKGGFH